MLGLKVDLLGRHGRLPAAGHAGHPAARRVHVQRDLQDGGLPVHAAPACSRPRRRPTPTAAPAGRRRRTRSSGSWTSSPHELGIDPMELRRQELDQARGVPVHDDRRADLRQRQLRGRDRRGRWSCSATTSCAREQQERRDRNDPVQLGIGISTFTEMCGLAPSRVLGSLSYGAGGWEAATDPDAADRQGRGRHRHHAARPGPRDRVEPDRRGRARRAVRGRQRDPRRHPRPRRRAWTPTGRARWSSAASRCTWPREKVVEKARKVAAHLLEAAEGDVEFDGGTFSVKGSPDAKTVDPGGRAGDVRGAQPARGHGADAQRRRGARPGELLLPARHPPVRGRGRHRDRLRRRSASTSRSTTSAT